MHLRAIQIKQAICQNSKHFISHKGRPLNAHISTVLPLRHRYGIVDRGI
jgi:hypothetical protein